MEHRCDLSTPLPPELIQEMEARVVRRAHGRIRDVKVELHKGGLILRGRTSSYYLKQLAQHALLEAAPLPLLANEIEVH